MSTTYGGDILPNAACRVKFLPKRTPGVHLDVTRRRETRSFIRAVDMFMMFFTAELVSTVCQYTNKYAWMKIFEKPSYAEADGFWLEVTPPEMLRFKALLLYMGIVQVPRLHMYWNTGSIYGGLLPAQIMSRKRFFSLLAFLHVSDPEDQSTASAGKLRKVWPQLQHINCSTGSHCSR